MNFSLFVFKFIDYGFDLLQNYSRYKDITVIKDIPYDEKDNKSCSGDIYYIKQEERKYPVYVNIHGGGFIAGDKKHRRSFSSFMAEQGMFVFNINYGLCPKYPFPEFIEHSIKALNFLKSLEKEYNLDLDNIFVGGDSAGGYISSMLGAIQSNDSLREKLNLSSLEVNIKGLIMVCGSYDMVTLLSDKAPFKVSAEIGEAVTGIQKKEIHGKKEGLNGYPYVTELYPETYINDKFPISFIAHSDGDFLVPKHGEKFIGLLNGKGVKVYEHRAKRILDIHCYPIFRFNKSSKKCLKQLQSFLEENIAL